MFCTACGTRLDESARFCISCGKPTLAAPEPSGSQASAGPQANAAGRKLRRVIATKKVAGVCAGFAEYFDMDLTLMRLIWVGLLLVPPHIGLVAYIISWVVLPKD